jgi:hypothetical protein
MGLCRARVQAHRCTQVEERGFRFALRKENRTQKILGFGIAWIAPDDGLEGFASLGKVSAS